MPGPSQLLRISAALLAQKDLRRRFNEDPDTVMNEFGLDAKEKKVLYRMDVAEIAQVVATEFGDFKKHIEDAQPDPVEFPPCSEDYTPELGGAGTEYPTPKPGIYRVRPRTATRTSIKAAGEKLEVVITGRSFRRGDQRAVVVIQRLKPEVDEQTPREVEKEWRASSDLFGTFRCSRLVARVAVVDAETEIKAADYRVIVENGPDPADETKAMRLETKHPRGYDFKVIDDEP